MGLCVDVDEHVGTAEIAQRLGVKRLQIVHDCRRRYAAFPLPVATVSWTLVWHWPDVRRWAIQIGRLGANEHVLVTARHNNESPKQEGLAREA